MTAPCRSLMAMLALLSITAGMKAAWAADDALLPGGTGKLPVTISAARLEYDSKAKTATYSGGVRAAQGEAHLQCARLQIFLASGNGKGGVRRMECFGPVTMVQRDQVGTGDHGSYDKAAGHIVLTGHVTLSQGPNISAGDRLVYNLAQGTAQLSGGPTKERVQGLFEPGSAPKDAAGGKKSRTLVAQ